LFKFYSKDKVVAGCEIDRTTSRLIRGKQGYIPNLKKIDGYFRNDTNLFAKPVQNVKKQYFTIR